MRFQSPLASAGLSSRSNSFLLTLMTCPRVRLFADDTALYLAISSTTEGQVLKTDRACLEKWEKM